MGQYQRCGECGHPVEDPEAIRAGYREELTAMRGAQRLSTEKALMWIAEDIAAVNRIHGLNLTLVYRP